MYEVPKEYRYSHLQGRGRDNRQPVYMYFSSMKILTLTPY